MRRDDMTRLLDTLQIKVLTLKQRVMSLSVKAFGDKAGHPFHGNQWTTGQGTGPGGLTPDQGKIAVEKLLRKATRARSEHATEPKGDKGLGAKDANSYEAAARHIEKGNWKQLRAHLGRVDTAVREEILSTLPAKTWGHLRTGYLQ